MLTKKQTFELYQAICNLQHHAFMAGCNIQNKEASEKDANAFAKVLTLLRINCKEDFSEWPKEEIK